VGEVQAKERVGFVEEITSARDVTLEVDACDSSLQEGNQVRKG